ncbi:hypothetical protein QBC47DRAFT_358565 [Echria macrotheca]|uniref:Uncharacterized protein n=1 Tax=Echria macrotheca TaxID=438768 RepID=A0AAJ0F6V8_9PEZI|nr:hypothetical protein QBC47DRAFT_358565 [Echria macrotheca]
MAQVYSDFIRHFDRHETLRVTRYNNELVVCWGRSRLLMYMRTSGIEDTQGTAVAQGNRPTSNAEEIPMNTAELVKLDTCYGRIKSMAALVADSAAIASASRGEKYSDLGNL